MKNYSHIILLLSLSILTFTNCKDKAQAAETKPVEETQVVEAKKTEFTADTNASTIEWKGFKPTGSHDGVIKLKGGLLNMADGKISSGTFLIDMTSITVVDIPKEEEGNAKLLGHLTSPDFFNVAQYPTAAFKITGSEEVDGKMMLSGNLNLKDIKNNITFPVSVSQDGDDVTLTSEPFTIDRSKWDVKYGSKSFFDNLGDKFIDDDIELKIMVKASKS